MNDFSQGNFSVGAPLSGNLSNVKVSDLGEAARWEGFSLSDSEVFQELLEVLRSIKESITEAFTVIYEVFDIVQTILEIVQTALELLDDILQNAIKLIIATLDELRRVIIQLLNDILNIGFYLYPHFVHYDWAGVLIQELVTPYGVSVDADGFVTSNANKKQTEFVEIVPDFGRSPGKFRYIYNIGTSPKGHGFQQFKEDVTNAITNTTDRWRPVFSTNTEVSGVLWCVAVDNVFPLIRFVIEFASVIGERHYSLQFALWLAQRLEPYVAAAYQLGLGNPETLEYARQFLVDAQSKNLDAITAAFYDTDDKPTVFALLSVNILQDTNGADAGQLNLFGYVDTDQQYINQLLNSDYYFGNYRSNHIKCKVSAEAQDGKVGIYLQRISDAGVGLYGQKTTTFGISRNNAPLKTISGVHRGIKIKTLNAGETFDSTYTFPLNQILNGDPVDYIPSKFKGITIIPPSSPSDGDFYFNPQYGSIILFKNSNWITSDIPETFVFTLWDEATQLQLGTPIVLWVPRFKMKDRSESQTITYFDSAQHRNITRTNIANYAFRDNYTLMLSGDAQLKNNSSLITKLSKNLSVPKNDVNAALDLPQQFAGWNPEIDLSRFDAFPKDIFLLDVFLTIDFLNSYDKNNKLYIVLDGQKTVLSGTLTDGGLFSGTISLLQQASNINVTILDFSNNKLKLKLTAKISSGTHAIEIFSSSYKTITPVTGTTIKYEAYSRPIVIRVNREQFADVEGPVILSPKSLAVGSTDYTSADMQALLGSVGDGFNFPPQNFLGQIVGTSEDRKTGAVAKYRWRGIKPSQTGIIVYNATLERVDVITQITEARIWRDDFIIEYEQKDYNFKVYAYNSLFVQEINNSFGADTDFNKNVINVFNNGKFGDYEKIFLGPTDFVLTITGDYMQPPLSSESPWILMNIKQWFDIVEPIDDLLKSLIKSIPVPDSLFDGVVALIEAIQLFLDNIEEFIKKIQKYINKLFQLLEMLGKTGFYGLAISSAAGTEGFLYRLDKAAVDNRLATAPYVTGLVLIAPDIAGGDSLVKFLFDFLPSGAIDGEPEKGSLSDDFREIANALKQSQEAAIDELKQAYDTNKQSVTEKANRIKKHFEA